MTAFRTPGGAAVIIPRLAAEAELPANGVRVEVFDLKGQPAEARVDIVEVELCPPGGMGTHFGRHFRSGEGGGE